MVILKNINIRKHLTANLLRQLCLLGLTLTLFCYFLWNIFYSNKGYFNYLKLCKELEKQQSILEKTLYEKLILERSISLFKGRTIDKDIVDEFARKALGFASKDEKVIIQNNETNEVDTGY